MEAYQGRELPGILYHKRGIHWTNHTIFAVVSFFSHLTNWCSHKQIILFDLKLCNLKSVPIRYFRTFWSELSVCCFTHYKYTEDWFSEKNNKSQSISKSNVFWHCPQGLQLLLSFNIGNWAVKWCVSKNRLAVPVDVQNDLKLIYIPLIYLITHCQSTAVFLHTLQVSFDSFGKFFQPNITYIKMLRKGGRPSALYFVFLGFLFLFLSFCSRSHNSCNYRFICIYFLQQSPLIYWVPCSRFYARHLLMQRLIRYDL